jgi:cytochrome P450
MDASSTADVAPAGEEARRARLAEWNPLAPSELACPYATLAAAQREAPIFYNEFYGGWVVTRYDDILQVLKDSKRFSTRKVFSVGEIPPDIAPLLPHGYPWDHPSLLNNDPPEHTPIRRLANEAFKPAAIAAREPAIRGIVNDLIDEFADDGKVELMSRFAHRVPGFVMCLMLDLPTEDTGRLLRWSDAMNLLLNPTLPAEERRAAARDSAAFYEYCDALVRQRSTNPGSDLLSDLILARNDAEDSRAALTHQELISIVSQLLIGGQDTTRHLLGNVVLRLLEHPEQLERVRAEPELAAAAVEETLRHTTSVKGLLRQTTEPVEIAGVTIPADAFVVVMWGAGNHDETKFERPAEFDLSRPDLDRHIAFSRFAHFCIGAPLARLEVRVAVQQLFVRLPGLRRADDSPPEWSSRPFHQGLDRLDVVWDDG